MISDFYIDENRSAEGETAVAYFSGRFWTKVNRRWTIGRLLNNKTVSEEDALMESKRKKGSQEMLVNSFEQ